ncbi:hypothetical protein B5K11_09550 [Rhizobium leguminosarum bv. trifolii]|uniref:hypothetical protein n=1 Tax=Rhizobium leguminosarum TaxID=384 RepID=UPI000E2ED7FB|nr:hypothetical protein [Rhizobium leguminosarum]RFB95190.1 hypothetical protein B5K11_09550 [Rhizobium leguminosarum bv. trifolii]
MSRLWYPKFLIDETLPTGRKSAEAWLPFLTGAVGKTRQPMFKPGDEVSFQWVERHGIITIRILPSGMIATTLRCPHTVDFFDGEKRPENANQLASDANSFWDLGESEIWSDTIEGFAQDYACHCISPDETDGQDVEIDTATWSEVIKFTISPDGQSLIPATSPETSNVQG